VRADWTGPPPFISLRQARIHLPNESTTQKSISGHMGSILFKSYLKNCGIVAIGLTVDAHAMGQPRRR
jgi:hypothetical protein